MIAVTQLTSCGVHTNDVAADIGAVLSRPASRDKRARAKEKPALADAGRMENLRRNTLRTASHYRKGRRCALIHPRSMTICVSVRCARGRRKPAVSPSCRSLWPPMPPETLGPAAPAGASQRYGATTFIRPIHRTHASAGSRHGFERLVASINELVVFF